MQGLGALEFMLFGNGAEAWLAEATPIAALMARAVAATSRRWPPISKRPGQHPDGFAHVWANPGADNPLYRTAPEAVTELFDVFVTRARNGARRAPQRLSRRGRRRRQAEAGDLLAFRRDSRLPGRQSCEACKALFEASRLAGLLPQDMAWIGTVHRVRVRQRRNARSTAADGPIARRPCRSGAARQARLFRLVTSSLSELFGTGWRARSA